MKNGKLLANVFYAVFWTFFVKAYMQPENCLKKWTFFMQRQKCPKSSVKFLKILIYRKSTQKNKNVRFLSREIP
jgi:hypothetical protein